MQRAGVKGIHIAERDTQRAREAEAARHVRQHLVGRGLLSRKACSRPSSAGARMRRRLPANGFQHTTGCDAAIYLTQPGADTRVRSWTPTAQGAVRLPGHPQRVDLDRRLLHAARGRRGGLPADLPLRLSPVRRRGAVAARDVRRRRQTQPEWKILDEHEIVDGIDELGVLLYGHAQERLLVRLAALDRGDARSSRRTRTRPACRSPRPCSPAWSGCWKIPTAASSKPTRWISAAASKCRRPYLGPVVGRYTDWTPLDGPPGLFPEDIDKRDPWQFSNVLVT